MPYLDRDSVLFVTLDSCRYDAFLEAATPVFDAIGPLHEAQAPCYFTFGSHAAMFMGFTPTASTAPLPLLNPKFSKLFKLQGAGLPSRHGMGYALDGRDVIDGFRNAGFATYGTGAVGWFDTGTPVGGWLTASFDEFLYANEAGSGKRQVNWLMERVAQVGEGRMFAFLNLGETHVPYWYPGADWPFDDNPCQPFQTIDRRQDCRRRQIACAEYCDRLVADLVAEFTHATILVCADHGDCWGEDGIWEHGVPHPMTLTVPMMMRLRGSPVGMPNQAAE